VGVKYLYKHQASFLLYKHYTSNKKEKEDGFSLIKYTILINEQQSNKCLVRTDMGIFGEPGSFTKLHF